jgi:hypothetical protein
VEGTYGWSVTVRPSRRRIFTRWLAWTSRMRACSGSGRRRH